jgi:uncharacterized protein
VRTETISLETSDGLTLFGESSAPESPIGALVMCHPHPLYGGDMDNPVVMSVVRAAGASAYATVRFDFRGVRRSGGTHDEGRGEKRDVVAALDAAEQLAPGNPLVLAGYSFGALVALGVTDPRITRWIVIAPPLTNRTTPLEATADPRPKRLIGPEHDQFTATAMWHAAGSSWANTTVVTVPMADHFLTGHMQTVANLAFEE